MFVESDYTWQDGFIMEGVNILPHLIAKDFKNHPHIKSVFLVDEDADRILDVALKRGIWDDAETYPDYVKQKEVDWVVLFSHKIKAEAEHYAYPWIEVQKHKDDLKKVLEILHLD